MYIMRMIIVLFHLVSATVFDVRYASVDKTHIFSAFGELLNFDRDKDTRCRKTHIYYKL